MFKYTISYCKFLNKSTFTTYENYHSRISDARKMFDFPQQMPTEVIEYVQKYLDTSAQQSDFEVIYDI